MTERPYITPMMETVLIALSTVPKTADSIWLDTLSMADAPASVRSTRGVLTRLRRIGYAAVECADGQDRWTITEAGLRHWPTEEELEETARKLRAAQLDTSASVRKSENASNASCDGEPSQTVASPQGKETKTMHSTTTNTTPQHLARYYRQVFALLAAQTQLTRVITSGNMTEADLAYAEAARDKMFAKVFGLSIGAARGMAATLPHDGMAATLPHAEEVV